MVHESLKNKRNDESFSHETYHPLRYKLKFLCGDQSISKTSTLNLGPDVDTDLLHQGCFYLSNLTCLRIEKSSVSSLRDLGSYYPRVTELSITECLLEDLDGLTGFPNLSVLRLPCNKITNVDSCLLVPNLCHLDLERNRISTLNSMEWLALCPKLVSLILKDNPVYNSEKSTGKLDEYLDRLKYMIPQLNYIDGEPLIAAKTSDNAWTRLQKSFSKTQIPVKFSRSACCVNPELIEKPIQSPDVAEMPLKTLPQFGVMKAINILPDESHIGDKSSSSLAKYANAAS